MNKKLLSGILVSSMALSMLSPLTALATETQEITDLGAVEQQTLASAASDFTFLNGEITKYNGSDSVVVIPSTINGQAVKKIGEKAFYNNDKILSLTIPEGVTEIGYYAFYSCGNLMEITVPASLSVVATGSFNSSSKISTVYYGGSENSRSAIISSSTGGTFFSSTWHYNHSAAGTNYAPTSKLSTMSSTPTTASTQFTFANGEIVSYNGTDPVVVIPSTINGQSVTKIADKAFYNNDRLLAVVIPNTVRELGYYAFYSCGNLRDVMVSDSLSVVNTGCFNSSSSIANVYYGGTEISRANIISSSTGGTFFTSTWHYNTSQAGNGNAPTSKLNTILSTPEALESSFTVANGAIVKYNGTSPVVVIPSYVNGQKITKIEEKAFYNNDRILALYIPNSITEICYYSFYSCGNLRDIALYSSVSVIGASAFNSTSSLSNVYYSGTETNRGNILMTSVGGNFLSTTWHYNTNLALTSAPSIAPSTPTPDPEPTPDPTPDPTPEPETTTPTTPTTPSTPSGDVNIYVDVTVNNWYFNFVDYVVTNNIMTGTGSNFQPEIHATRGTIAESLANMSLETIPYTSNTVYTDVAGTGFESVVAWCASKGIMTGNSATDFGVNQNVTREQFALILKQFATYQGVDTSVSLQQVNSLNAFSDVGSISSWAKEGMAWAVASGLMEGSNGALNPSGNILRAEVATMLYTYGTTLG